MYKNKIKKRYNDRSPEDDLEISSDEHALHFYLGSKHNSYFAEIIGLIFLPRISCKMINPEKT